MVDEGARRKAQGAKFAKFAKIEKKRTTFYKINGLYPEKSLQQTFYECIGILHLSQKVVYTFVISRFRREIGNWKLEIRKKHINSDVLSNFQFRISSFSIRFSDSTSDFQPENIPHFREKCKLMDEGCPIFNEKQAEILPETR